jgi:hypothetical protein
VFSDADVGFKVAPNDIAELYRDMIIPLTKQVTLITSSYMANERKLKLLIDLLFRFLCSLVSGTSALLV